LNDEELNLYEVFVLAGLGGCATFSLADAYLNQGRRMIGLKGMHELGFYASGEL
jgi:hypothetical protein